MGLSNQERTRKILYGVRGMVEKAEKLEKQASDAYPDENKILRLAKFCNSLWPALMGKTSNGAHWLIGSSSSNLVLSENEDLWSIAVCSSLPEVNEGDVIPSKDELYLSKLEWHPLKERLNIESLLGDNAISTVCSIYKISEDIVYALRRYDDDYLSSKKEFSDLIASIQGTCFSILYNNKEFTICYVVNQICNILYADKYRFDEDKYEDVVDEWLHTSNMHHDIIRVIGRKGENLEWIVKQHLILLASEGIDLKRNRVLVALRMSGRKYHYSHQHKSLFEILKKDKDMQDESFLAEVSKELEACKKAKIEDEESSQKEYKEENKASCLYGWNALPKKIKEVETKSKKKSNAKKK